MGGVSVALATSISAWINLGWLAAHSALDQKSVINRDLMNILVKITLVTISAFFATLLMRCLVQNLPIFFLYDHHSLSLSRNFSAQLFDFSYQSRTYIFIWLVGCFLLELSPGSIINSLSKIKNMTS